MTHSVCISDWGTLSRSTSPVPYDKDESSSSSTSSGKESVSKDATKKTSVISVSKLSRQSVHDAEVTITYNRIVSIFERAISRLEFAAIIPNLIVDSPRELRGMLTEQEFKIVAKAFFLDIEQTCPLSGSNRSSDTFLTSSSLNESKSSSEKDASVCNVLQAFEILYNQPRIREITKDIEDAASTPTVLFLYHFRSFVDEVLSKMRLTPEQARASELHYRQVWRDQKQCAEDVTKLNEELETAKSEHKKALDNVMIHYKKDLVAVEGITRKSAESMRQMTTKSEREQLIAWKASEVKQNELRLTLFNVTTDLEALRETNLRTEQIMRNKRFKAQSHLQTIINKFDTEIGERHREFQLLTQIYETDKREKHALQAFIRDFESTYNDGEKGMEEEEAYSTNFQ